MRATAAPAAPWSPNGTRRALRGRVVMRLRPELDPAHIFHHTDVRLGSALAADRIDGGGTVDRALHRFSPRMQVTRVHASARNCCVVGQRHLDWDDLEMTLGLSRTFRVELDPAAPVLDVCHALSSLEAVESASPVYLSETPFSGPEQQDPEPSERRVPVDYGHRMVGAQAALEAEPGDSALIVAVVDSGVALDHPELKGRLRPGSDVVDMPPGDPAEGIRWVGDTEGRDNAPYDAVGHGTSCAGIIGANGLRMAPGLAGAARVLPIRALAGAEIEGRRELTALGALSDLDAAVKLSVDLGARVLNLSFGTPAPALRDDDDPPHADVVAYALQRGCVLIAASGNHGGLMKYYPAALPGVIAVGAVGPEGRVSRFTSRGEHVALCAPGEGIYAPTLHGRYGRSSGTSFAAPFVTAAAALLAARCARRSMPFDVELLRRALREGSRPLPASAPDGSGAGILHVPTALARLDELLDQHHQDLPTAAV